MTIEKINGETRCDHCRHLIQNCWECMIDDLLEARCQKNLPLLSEDDLRQMMADATKVGGIIRPENRN